MLPYSFDISFSAIRAGTRLSLQSDGRDSNGIVLILA